MNDIVRPTGLVGPRPLGERPLPPTAKRFFPYGRARCPDQPAAAPSPGGGADADGLRRASSAGATAILAADGISVLDVVLVLAFAASAPWTVLGVVNAGIGFLLARLSKAPLDAIAPFAAAGDVATPVTSRVAVFMTLRNEDAARAVRRLALVRESILATGEGAAYGYFVLSDTSDPGVAAAEEAEIDRWRAQARPGRAHPLPPQAGERRLQGRQRARLPRDARRPLRPECFRSTPTA